MSRSSICGFNSLTGGAHVAAPVRRCPSQHGFHIADQDCWGYAQRRPSRCWNSVPRYLLSKYPRWLGELGSQRECRRCPVYLVMVWHNSMCINPVNSQVSCFTESKANRDADLLGTESCKRSAELDDILMQHGLHAVAMCRFRGSLHSASISYSPQMCSFFCHKETFSPIGPSTVLYTQDGRSADQLAIRTCIHSLTMRGKAGQADCLRI